MAISYRFRDGAFPKGINQQQSYPTVKSSIDKSGNSNVVVYVDNLSIAYAILSYLSISNDMDEQEFEKIVNRFNTLLNNDEIRNLISESNSNEEIINAIQNNQEDNE